MNNTSTSSIESTDSKMNASLSNYMQKAPLDNQFDENVLMKVVNQQNLEKITAALKKLAEDEVSKKKRLVFNDYRFILDVNCFKIANCPKRMVKL